MNRYSVKYILPIVLWTVVIFVSSSIPQAYVRELDVWVWRKLVHLVYFGVLALLIQRAFQRQTRWRLAWKYVQIISILLALCYGASDEIHQMFTPGRHAQVTDVLIDGFGAALFIIGSMVVRVILPNRVREAGVENEL